jgi:hypothetical protein
LEQPTVGKIHCLGSYENRWDFALKYAENFIRWYAAFRLRDTKILSAETFKYHTLIKMIRDNPIFSKTFKAGLGLIESILDKDMTIFEERALWLPRRISDIEIPRFTYVRLRERLGIGSDKEIDIHGAAGVEHWIAESKWYQDRAVGVSLVKKLLEKADVVKKERTPDFVRAWFFAHNGFTQDAESFMQEQNVTLVKPGRFG